MRRMQTYTPKPGTSEFKRIFGNLTRDDAETAYNSAEALREAMEDFSSFLEEHLPEDLQATADSHLSRVLACASQLNEDQMATRAKEEDYQRLLDEERQRESGEPRLERTTQDSDFKSRAKAKREFDAMFPQAKLVNPRYGQRHFENPDASNPRGRQAAAKEFAELFPDASKLKYNFAR